MQKRIFLPLILLAVMIFTFQACDNYVIDFNVEYDSYSESVQPIFDSKCTRCHAGGNLNLNPGQSHTSLTNNYVNLEDPDESIIITRLIKDGDHQGSGATQKDILTILAWIEDGTPNN